MPRFTIPRDLYYGKGSIDYLKQIVGKKAILVLGGGSMKRFGFVDKVLGYLKETGIEVKLIENVEPDPSVETVLAGAKVMQEFQPDWIIAMGGGSPIDAAKAMWVFYEHDTGLSFDDIKNPFTIPTLRKKAKFLAIPSTSGTATEVTAFSVITDYKTGVKYPLADFNITPDIAIVDPELAETMPQKLVAHTGMDALTHAVEAYVSTYNQPFTNPLALEAIKLVVENIEKSYEGNMSSRETMHYAQCMAGMAFSNALLGIVHSMAHKTGAAFTTGHIPHGCANAIYLPYVIQYNAHECKSRYVDIANYLGLSGNNDDELINSLCELINNLNEKLNIPNKLKDCGVDEGEFISKLNFIAEAAVSDACTGSNPRSIDSSQMIKLLKCIYYGTKVDF